MMEDHLVPHREVFGRCSTLSRGGGGAGKGLLALSPSALGGQEGEQKGPESLQASLPKSIWGRPVAIKKLTWL